MNKDKGETENLEIEILRGIRMPPIEDVVVGVDLGGTKIHTARIRAGKIDRSFKMKISSHANKETVLSEVIQAIETVMNSDVKAIGIGVPGLVDTKTGVIYDIVNIPSWKKVYLGEELRQQFSVPVFINNDANCFTLGEFYFGHGKGLKNLVGLTLGTGMGAGIVIDGKLYCGTNCGAGEFGMLPYLDGNYESYCSGQFFKNKYHIAGEQVFNNAQNGDAQALNIMAEFGRHLGQAITAIFYALDPQMIVLGGSVSKSFPFFEKTMREELKKISYQNALKNMEIALSSEINIAVMGAAALAYQENLIEASATPY